VSRVGKRELPERPRDLEFHVAELALDHRVAYIVARGVWQHQGQITVHAGPIAAAQAALQVEHAGEAVIGRRGRCRRPWSRILGAPADLRLSLRVGIGKRQIAQLGLDFAARELPLGLCRQLVERYQRILEDAGQIERAIVYFQGRLATVLGEVEINIGAADAGPAGRCVRGDSSRPTGYRQRLG